jgi:tetratricopeptide (TPR) repeat protein
MRMGMTVGDERDDLAAADRLRRRCEFEAVEEALRAAAAAGADLSAVEIASGRLEMDRDDFTAAVTRFEKAAALDPERAEAVGWQVAALSRLCRFADARAVAVAGLKRFPGSAPLGVALGRLYFDEERRADALEEFERVLARHPEDDNALEWRIATLCALHRYPEAEAAGEAASALHPGKPWRSMTVMWTLWMDGRLRCACYAATLMPSQLSARRSHVFRTHLSFMSNGASFLMPRTGTPNHWNGLSAP